MTRGNARELAVHLIYGRAFTGEEPEQVVSTRLDKEYYEKLKEENDVYSDRPSRGQLRYLDSVVSGVANREEELNQNWPGAFCSWLFLRSSMWRMFPPVLPYLRLSASPRSMTVTIPVPLSMAFWAASPGA